MCEIPSAAEIQVIYHPGDAGCRSAGIKPLEITALGSSRSLLGTSPPRPQLSSCRAAAVGCYANRCAGAAAFSPSAQSIHLLGFFFCFVLMARLGPVLSQRASSLPMGYEHSTGQLEPHSTSTGWMQPRLGHDPPPSNFLQLKSHPERNHTTRCLFVVVGVGFFAHGFLIVSFIYSTFLDGHMKEGTCLPYPSDWVINRNESSNF